MGRTTLKLVDGVQYVIEVGNSGGNGGPLQHAITAGATKGSNTITVDNASDFKVGSFMSRSQCEAFLNRWISHYVLLDDMAPQDLKAKFPLREARIEVSEIPGKPGAYRAVAFLRPHYQLDELSVSLRLVAELPPPAK